MALLPAPPDPTLEAADRALEDAQVRRGRPYMGMSAVGAECPRQLWYSFRHVQEQTFDAATLKRFEDGHRTETLAIERLRMLSDLEVHDVGEDGHQFGFEDLGGHFRGHMDGAILGLIQAPQTWHCLEIKACADKKLDELKKAIADVGQKLALRKWNMVYYAQAILYMDYAGLDRHYLVALSPGGRRWMSVRTDADPVEAQLLKDKAERIIFSARPPERAGRPENLICKWCDYREICHEATSGPQRNCRTCLHSTPEQEGGWSCARWRTDLDNEDQARGCDRHLFIPDLVPFEQIDAGEDRVSYRRPDGTVWIDGATG